MVGGRHVVVNLRTRYFVGIGRNDFIGFTSWIVCHDLNVSSFCKFRYEYTWAKLRASGQFFLDGQRKKCKYPGNNKQGSLLPSEIKVYINVLAVFRVSGAKFWPFTEEFINRSNCQAITEDSRARLRKGGVEKVQ